MRLYSGPNHAGDVGLARSGVVFKNGGGGGTQVVKNDPPEWLKPFQIEIGQRASELSKTPLQFYPGQTYAGLSPETEAALQMQTQRALAGSPVTQAMQAELTRTLGGQYLDPTTNPAFQKGAQAIQSQVGSMFAGAGRYGSGAMANQAREALTDLAAKTYDAERQRQIQGMLFAPTAAAQDYADAAKLAEVGGVREDLAQQAINEAINRFNFGQMEPWQRLQMYSSVLSGIPSIGGTQTQTARRSIGFNDVMSGLTGLGSLGLLGYLALSDKRIKTDIKKVGKTDDGLNVYTYRYKGSPQIHMGVLAQEVERKKPEAVVDLGGVKAVNYGLLGG